MRSDDDMELARLAGARRRAIDEGREPPPDPVPTAAPQADASTVASAGASSVPDPSADGAGATAGDAASSVVGDANAAESSAPPVARGPWFDARAFFLGWLAMVVALIAGAGGFLIAAAGFAVAYVLARRHRLANAAVSVTGGTVVAVVVLALVFVAALVLSG